MMFLLVLLSVSIRVQSTNVAMCNTQGHIFPFDELTDFDLTRIKQLVQVQIVARHGAIVGGTPLNTIFPRLNLSKPDDDWFCNFTQITSRSYGVETFMAFQKNYIVGEAYVGRNCLHLQSSFQVAKQFRADAKMIKNYYIGSKPQNLWSTEELNQIMHDTFIQHKYKNNNIPHIKVISTDMERTYASASVFFKYFLTYSTNESTWKYDRNSDYLYSYTHDVFNDPYLPQYVAGCNQLKPYVNERGLATKKAQEYVQSEFVKEFFTQWKQEVGTTFDLSYTFFKYCENIIWMFCAGFNVVPDAISQSLFDKVHNYTLEYRAKSLNNAISQETVSLAAMPFAWILKTLMEDRVHYLQGNEQYINGYIDAKEAKLLFHSTRGISTLYLFKSLNISSGMEPVMGNLVNFELYERTDSDYVDNVDVNEDSFGFGKYMFRILFMGKYLPFPGCEEDYQQFGGRSSLCNLNVFMNAIENISMPMSEWVPYCHNITETYFAQRNKTDILDYEYMVQTAKHLHSSGGIWFLFIGVICGALIVWFMDRKRYFKSVVKDKYDTI